MSEPIPPKPADQIDLTALTRWMEANVPGFTGPLTAHKFAGGQSNPTYRIDSPSGSYVLRRKPFGPLLPSAHAVDREYKVIAGLHPTGFPVAKPYGLCEDDSVIGAAFYVMEMVEGRTFWNGPLPEASSPEERTTLYHAMIDTLADLHKVDYEAAGLGDYGKPGNYFERQVGRWTKQYRGSQTDDLPSMEKLIAYLPASLPDQKRTSIVHGDFRIDNMIFASAEPRVLALLDWELSTLGDPMADLAYFMMSWVSPAGGSASLVGADLDALGIPTMDAMVERYAARTGMSDIPDMNWYFAFNLFRLAGIVQGIKKRVIDGNASNAKAAEMAKNVPLLADSAWHFAKAAGARD